MIILMIIVAAFILMIQSGKNCEITISGTIRFPALESGGEDWKTIRPVSIEWASGSHEAPYTAAGMKNGSMQQAAGYGPAAFRGAFSGEELRSIIPELSIDQNWPFEVNLFNCHQEGSYRMFLDVQADAQIGAASADFYVFHSEDGMSFAHPEITHWEGKTGEEIILRSEF